MTHPNSHAAFDSILPTLGERHRRILHAYGAARRTDREILYMVTGKIDGDPNKVRPRITELVEMGVLEECGSRTDDLTGRPVRLCRRVTGGQGVMF